MSQTFTTRPEIRGTFGVVTSTHWIGTAVGMGILERGGNAFDAAVATGFALQIVEPHLNGPGGEVPIILQAAGADEPTVICGQGVAPQAATIEEYHRRDIKLVPGTGLLAAVVPGAFDAWMLLLRDYGTMKLRDVLEPAIGYAINGFPVAYRVAASIFAISEYFTSEWPTSANVWLPDGNPPSMNQQITTKPIGETYLRILKEAEAAGSDRIRQIEAARNCFYEGFVAEAIDGFCRQEFHDGTGRKNSGLLTGDDMAAWRAGYEKTVSIDYHGLKVHKTGPWGQGPVMLQCLAMLKDHDIGSMDPVGAEFVHTVSETIKLAFADRDVFYGDPDHAEVPLEHLLSDKYNDERRKLITDTASDEFRPGMMGDAENRRDILMQLAGSEVANNLGGGEPTFADVPQIEGDTVHLDVADKWGNVVSATPSGGWLQSSPAIPQLGFNLNTRAQMFWLNDGLPSSLAPGKRPRTTLTPTLVTRDGAPCLAFGSPGGDQQDQWSLIMFLRNFHHTKNLQTTIDAPMFNTRHLIWSFYPRGYEPRLLLLEDRFEKPVRDELTRRGHILEVHDEWALGRLCAVARGKNGVMRAAATPRYMQAYAAGR